MESESFEKLVQHIEGSEQLDPSGEAQTAFRQMIAKVERNPALYSFTTSDQVHKGIVFCTEGEFPIDMALHVLDVNNENGMVLVQTGPGEGDTAELHFTHLGSATNLMSQMPLGEAEEPFEDRDR